MDAPRAPVNQARKLGITPGCRVHLHAAPAGWQLNDPPVDVVLVGPEAPVDLIIAFHLAAAELAGLTHLTRRIHPAGTLWVAWPRRAGGHRSDITDEVVRTHALPLGVVDVKVAAIDEDWSGLRLVWRLDRR